MIRLGLRSSELRLFQSQLRTHHKVAVRVEVLTLTHTRVADVSDRLLDGQVTVDVTADVTRSATVTLLDADHSLSFDTDSPADTALFLDRMLRVVYCVWVEALDQWVNVPVFCGPVTKLSRDGDQVNVEAQGKEILAQGAIWRPMNLRKGLRKTDAIQTLLRYRAGETRFIIADLSPRIRKTISLDREAVAWKTARSLASSINRQLFYDGAGWCRLRPFPKTVLFGWDETIMTGPLQVDYGEAPTNTVYVTGATPKGHKKPLTASSVAPASSMLSPDRLGRNGVPRYLLQTVSDDKLRTHAEAQARADETMESLLREHTDATFDSLPVPHLDPNDLVHVHSGEGSLTFRLSKFTLPLVLGNAAPMTVGYVRNVAVTRHRRRRHR